MVNNPSNNDFTTKKHFFFGSVRFRLTFCFSILIIISIILSLWYFVVVNTGISYHELKQNLRLSVNSIYNKLTNCNSISEMNDIFSDEYACEMIIFDQNHNYIFNTRSINDLNLYDTFTDGDLRSASFDGENYYIYDKIVFTNIQIDNTVFPGNTLNFYDFSTFPTFNSSNFHTLFIRGYIHVPYIYILNKYFYKHFLIFIPLLSILLSLIFYYFVRKFFKPLDSIKDTAQSIAIDNDFSNRIKITSNDEFADLSCSLNKAFDLIKDSIDKERQFTSDATHELRTPTAVIFAQTEYLHSICRNPEEKQSCEVILNQTVKMSRLISELLTLTRMDHGKQSLILEKIDLSELLELVIEESYDFASEHSIALYSDIQPHIIMIADQTMMMRVFMNLINNSVKYGISGGWIKIYLYVSDNEIIFSISDNGIGIAEENLPKIWERFYQVNSSRSNKNVGSGLGLPIVKWIVEAHGGKITVESTLAKGTTFKISFPK